MERFIIKQIVVTGVGVRDSILDLKDGVNIAFGPSNTGKSYILSCINFILEGVIPFTVASTGYDTVKLRFETVDGKYYAELTRRIETDTDEDKGDSKVDLWTNLEWTDGEYLSISNNELSRFLLRMFGITEEHKIISNQDFKQITLGIRSLVHFFYLDEDHIIQQETALDLPRHSMINARLAALIFLLSGDDLSSIVPTETKEERERRLARSAGVLAYLRAKLNALNDSKAEMEKKLEPFSDIIEDARIDEIIRSIAYTERRIVDATSESHDLLSDIYTFSSKLEEAQYLYKSYQGLQSQYESDIQRLHFITDGLTKSADRKHIAVCPFCNNEIKERKVQRIERQAVEAELANVEAKLQDLLLTEADIEDQISDIREKLRGLYDRNEEIERMIKKELQPYDAELKKTLSDLTQLARIRQELADLTSRAKELDEEINAREQEEDSSVPKFNGRKQFDGGIWKKYSDLFSNAVEQCAYPNFVAAHLAIKPLDAVVNGKHKKYEGKGYRAFLNSLVLFCLMKILEADALYRPALLFLDSPILSLKENIEEKDKATTGMRSSLIKYIINNVGANQVIIVENEIPDGLDYSTVNLIEFTKSDTGRYGFLTDLNVEPDKEENADSDEQTDSSDTEDRSDI